MNKKLPMWMRLNPMNVYRFEKDNGKGTVIEVKSHDKVLFNRLEVAIDHVLNEFKEKSDE